MGRSYKSSWKAKDEHVGNDVVKRMIPSTSAKEISPFLLIDHMGPWEMQPGDHFKVPPHPHVGFQTLTYFTDGGGWHKDSLDHDIIIEPGDVAWMKAGAGIIHSEENHPRISAEGGTIQGFQIWVNLPRSERMSEPKIHKYPSSEIPELVDEHSEIRIILGELEGKKSPVELSSPVYLFHVKMKANSSRSFQLQSDQHFGLYIFKGKAKGKEDNSFWYPEGEGEIILESGDAPMEALLFGGKDLKEEFVSYGPFIVNDMKQLQEVARDYQMGLMGRTDF